MELFLALVDGLIVIAVGIPAGEYWRRQWRAWRERSCSYCWRQEVARSSRVISGTHVQASCTRQWCDRHHDQAQADLDDWAAREMRVTR